MGIELWWQGYGGLKFVDVAKKLRYLATLQDSPQFIVMHCGGNDLGQIPLSKLLYRVKWDIRLMASVFPDCQLVWFFILPQKHGGTRRGPGVWSQLEIGSIG